MSELKYWIAGIAVFGAGVLAVAQESGVVRTWTNAEGKSLEAVLVHATEAMAELKTANGKIATVPFASLSKPDQNFILELQELGLVVPPLPKSVQSSPAGSHFAITGQGEMGPEFAQRFEYAYAAASALPFNLDLKPGPDQDKFSIQYTDSAGFRSFLSSKKMDPNLQMNAAFLADEVAMFVNYSNIRADKLTSLKQAEIDHEGAALALMRWKYVLPTWFYDGLAGSVAAIPTVRNEVQISNHEAGLKQFLVNRFELDPKGIAATGPEILLKMGSDAWTPTVENRAGAVILAYFFTHLDETASPSVPVVQALESVRAMREESASRLQTPEMAAANYERKRTVFNKEVTAYNDAINKFKAETTAYNNRVREFNSQLAAGLPEIQRINVGEKPVMPKAPVSPVMPSDPSKSTGGSVSNEAIAKVMPHLLRGRTPAELTAQVTAAFAKIGVPLKY
ncbi:MAG: hypothetical protein ACKVJU_17040 [Verrucomicrobiales bacterium]